jgi:hypothetical protein
MDALQGRDQRIPQETPLADQKNVHAATSCHF